MPGAAVSKFQLWRKEGVGVKSRFSDALEPSARDRDDISPLLLDQKIERGDTLQELRLKHYPSINVDRDKLFAGYINENKDAAEDLLIELGFRNNPTAYVEVTEENGPDDGSYARTFVTETGGRFDIPKLAPNPSFYKRMKRQLHVVIYDVGDRTEFLVHDERSAWLQPARHVIVNDAEAQVGVRDFRDLWFDQFGRELRGKSQVVWDTTH